MRDHLRRRQARRTLLACAAFTALAAACAGGAAAAAPPTQKVIFSPFRASVLAPGIGVERNVRGSCVDGSEVAKRWDAWSCSAGRRVYDPCFSSSRTKAGAIVVCMSSPWANATLLELTRPLPLALTNVVGDPRTHAPWALTLANGERCALTTRRLGRLGDEPINYVCAGSAVLAGLPARTARLWTIRRAATVKAAPHTAPIRRAWW